MSKPGRSCARTPRAGTATHSAAACSLSLARAFHTGQIGVCAGQPFVRASGRLAGGAARADSVRHSALLLYGAPLATLLAGALPGAPLAKAGQWRCRPGLAASLLALAWHARRAAGLDAHRPAITRLLSQPSRTCSELLTSTRTLSRADWSA